MGIDWKLEFDICAIIFLIAFSGIYVSKRRFPSMMGRLYEFMLLDLLVSSVTECFSIAAQFMFDGVPVWLLYFLNCTYMTLIGILCYMFSIYVFLAARKGKYTKGRWYWYAGYTPALLVSLAIITTPLTGWVFVFDENKAFVAGPLYYAVYIVIGVYLLITGGVCLYYRRSILQRDRISFGVFLLGMIGGMVYQSITVGGLVTNFIAAMGLMIIYYVQQDSVGDASSTTGLYGRGGLSVYMNELINAETPFTLLAAEPDHLVEFIHEKGSFIGDSVIRQISDRFRDRFGAESTYYLGAGRFVAIYFEDNPAKTEAVMRELFEQPLKVAVSEYGMTVSGCYIGYPKDFASSDEALDILEKGLNLAEKSDESTLVSTSNFNEVRDGIVARLQEEQVDLERQKQEAEDAKNAAVKADRSKSVFLANMSHEIRTPLTTVLGMTELLLQGDLSDNSRTHAESIYNAGRSLLQIINDILDFSKIEAGRLEIVNEPYDIGSVLDAAVDILKVRCGEKPIRIVTEIDPELPKVLKGDEVRIRQVLSNLLSNAAKYTDEGRIVFSVKWDAGSSQFSASVSDTGHGIRPEDVDRLFKAFDRINEQANRSIEGTGLGLPITQKILELMGGTLKVESEYGVGSTFAFKLVQEAVEGDVPMTSGKIHKRFFTAQDTRVLVVDDNSMNRVIAEEFITRHRITVDQAESGRACLEAVKRQHYDIIFLDHMMPEMDGIETLRIMKSFPEFIQSPVPVIAFTANAVSGMKEEFKKAGFTAFLSKPISMESMDNMLIEHLPADKVTEITEEEYEAMSRSTDSGFDLSELDMPGIDTAAGLTNTGSDTDKYFKVLKVLLANRANVRERLSSEFAAQDIANYTIDVHGLKSTMASIGASELSERARKLEQAGHANDTDYIRDNHDELMRGYEAICDTVDKAVGAYDEYAKRCKAGALAADLGAVKEFIPEMGDVMTGLRLLVDEYEGDSAKALALLMAHLSCDAGEQDIYNEIADKLELFDYSGAAEIIAGHR